MSETQLELFAPKSAEQKKQFVAPMINDIELEERLESLAEDGQADWDEYGSYSGPEWLSPWSAISALHKSVRRSYTEITLQMTSYLLKTDPDRFWNRIGVIALEDVGLGDPGLVASIAYVAGRGRRRKELGEPQLAMAFVRGLVESPKDRTSCDLICLAQKLAEKASIQMTMSEKRCLAALTDHSIDPIRRAMYVVMSHKAGEIGRRSLHDWYEISGLLTEDQRRVIRFSKGGAEEMALVYGIAAQELAKTDLALDLPDSWWIDVDLEPFDGIPPAAFDQYTREGLRAFAYFSKASKKVMPWMAMKKVGAERAVSFIGRLTFRAEGDTLSPRIQYEFGQICRSLYMDQVGAEFGLSEGEFAEAVLLMREELPLLRHARGRVMKLIPSGG